MKVRRDLLDGCSAIRPDDITVVDDYYDRPDAIRTTAMRLDYLDRSGRYPGIESVQSLFSPRQIHQLSDLAGERLAFDAAVAPYGKIRIGFAGEPQTTKVHLDHVDWSAIVYLSPTRKPRAGLTIYEHRELGLARVDSTIFADYGCQTRSEFDGKYVRPYSVDANAWIPLLEIEYIYNRMVLIRSGSLFHGISDIFGDTIESGRMTQSYFMTSVKAECGEEI